MKNKISIKFILQESFIPFFLLLLAFFFFLFYIDRVIENNSRKAIVINLESKEESEEESGNVFILQKLDIKKYSGRTAKIIEKINELLRVNNFTAVIDRIGRLDTQIRQSEDIRLILSYSYYKINKTEKSLAILNSIPQGHTSKVYFYYGLIYGKNPKTYNMAIKYYLKYLKTNKISYEGHSNTGIIYYKMKQYKKAAGHFKQAVKVSAGKRKAAALYRLGTCYEKTGQIPRAVKKFKASIKLHPAYIKPRIKLAHIKYKKNPDIAVKDYIKIISIDRSYMRGYYILGKYYFEKHKYIRAVRILKEGIAMSPHAGILKSYLGHIYLEQDEFKNAFELYSVLVEEYPQNEIYRFNLARAYYGLKQYKEAAYQYKRAIDINRSYYKAILNLGATYSRMNDYSNAVKYYNLAKKLKPNAPTIYYNLGILYNKQKFFKKAIENFKKAISLKEDYAEAYFNLAYIYSRENNEKKAILNYLKAIEKKNTYILPYVNLSIMHIKAGRKDRAIELLARGIGKTGSLRLKNMLANLYYTSGDYSSSLRIYREIISSDKDNTGALMGLAKVTLKKKNYSETLKYIKRYIFLKPKAVKARYILMVSLFHTGKYKSALKQIQIIQNLKPGYKKTDLYRKKINNIFKKNKT